MEDEKYVVFKKSELDKWLADVGRDWMMPQRVMDAVVIRRQDMFAAPALEAYSNAMMCAVEALREAVPFDDRWERLRDIADYFHQQAEVSYMQARKLPD